MKSELKKYFGAGITVFILFLIIYYWGMIENAGTVLLYALTPLVGGFVTAYIVNLPLSWFERNLFGGCRAKVLLYIKRPLCILLSFATVAALIFLVVTLIVPELILCFELLIDELPPVIENLYKTLDEQYGIAGLFEKHFNQQFGENTDWRDIVEKAVDFVITGLGGVMGSVFTVISSVFSTVFNVFISLIFSVYLLSGKEKLICGVNRLSGAYIKPKIKSSLDNILNVVDNCFHRFIVGQCTEAVILGILCIVGMSIFGFPYATMIGTLVGFTALIPVAGAYIGAGIGAFMVFTAGSWLQALLFVAFIIVLQQLEGNLIYPKVVGKSIGLPGIWVLAAVTVGGAVMGIPGMLLGVPLVAAVYKLVKTDVDEKLCRKERESREQTADQETHDAEEKKSEAETTEEA